ncbi:hypothetical protein V6N13_092485 [Hibiscus sabdariffa]|uniref:Uncharacterized protein n=2 Tax=Hibiscus sabdariffa TaxID=183260 RepID=A0ABR1ZVM7_9ROSI
MDIMVSRVWYIDNFAYVFSQSVGKAGGILLVWEKGCFCVTSMNSADRYIIVKGNWAMDNWYCGIMGVYASCILEEQSRLWVNIGAEIFAKSLPWFVRGDFNMITKIEKRGGGSSFSRGMSEFCEFIDRNALFDVPLLGNKFTWFGHGN